MKSAQFYKGMIEGTEDFYESPDIYQVIPQEKLDELITIDKPGEYSKVYLKERIVAKTRVFKPKSDSLGRDGIINHTVIYRFDINVEHDGLKYLFDVEQFKKDAQAGRYNFVMPPSPELKRPLDYPAKLEV